MKEYNDKSYLLTTILVLLIILIIMECYAYLKQQESFRKFYISNAFSNQDNNLLTKDKIPLYRSDKNYNITNTPWNKRIVNDGGFDTGLLYSKAPSASNNRGISSRKNASMDVPSHLGGRGGLQLGTTKTYDIKPDTEISSNPIAADSSVQMHSGTTPEEIANSRAGADNPALDPSILNGVAHS
jgi:hypothetical protein